MEYDKDIYFAYLDMYKLLNTYFYIKEAMIQQFYNGFYQIHSSYTSLYKTLKTEIEYRQQMPLLITEEKYNEIKSKSEAKSFKEKESYIDLFVEAVSFYADQEEENLLTPFLIKYKGKPIKDNSLKDAYIKNNIDYFLDHENCYYQLRNNKSSESVTVEEFIEDYYKRPLFKGLTAEQKEYIKERFINNNKGLTDIWDREKSSFKKEYETTVEDIKDSWKTDKKATTHRLYGFISILKDYLIASGKDKTAEEITKLQEELLIIGKEAEPDQADLIKYYNYLRGNNLKLFESFEKELTDVVQVIDKDLMRHKLIKTSLKDQAKDKRIISVEKLYNEDLYTYKNIVSGAFLCEYPQAKNGVAFIKELPLRKEIRENFKDEVYKPDLNVYDDYDITQEVNIEELKDLKETNINYFECLLIPALKNIVAINYFYEAIEDIYKLQGLKETYGYNINELLKRIRKFNVFSDYIQEQLNELYEDTKEGIIKREYVRQAFEYIDLKKILPDEEQIKEAREKLVEIKTFEGKNNSYSFMNLYIKGNKDTIQEINKSED